MRVSMMPNKDGSKTERSFLAAIVNSSDDAIISRTLGGTVLTWNPAAERMFGYTAAEIIGKPMKVVFPPDRQNEEQALLERIARNESVSHYETVRLRKDGTRIDVSVSLSPIHSRDGRVVGASKIVRDITQRKRVEAAMAEASRMLEASNAELQQFAHTVSHDLQEPLRMVTAYLGLLERSRSALLDDEGREYLGFARDGAQRMSAMIHDLLDYARVAGRGLELAAVDTAEVLDEAIANLAATFDESGADIARAGSLPPVSGDRGQLVRVFQNLIGNAMKYRDPARPPRIRIAATRRGGEWLFAVEDNGIGIAAEHFERVFQIFQRLHGRGQYEGTGIGLSIVKRIIDLHGGQIWVESEPGRGSTFFFTLPDRAAPSRP